MTDNILVIGNGAREHAIVWKLLQSPLIRQINVAPGNGGIKGIKNDKVKVIDNLDVKNNAHVINWCKTNKPSLVVVGPEDPLDRGLADELRKAEFLCFGPNKSAAQIECSKAFAKSFMKRNSIPTANFETFTNSNEAKKFLKNEANSAYKVIKASGLAAGKGVIVCSSVDEACEAIDKILDKKEFGSAGEVVVIEELMVGEEMSVLAFTDGVNVSVMPPAQDHKRAYENDEGPNTGGMGAYCPYPFVDEQTLKFIEKEIIKKAIDGLRNENAPFVGTLYAGLMLTKNGPKVVEFNCRFGDPETQSILPLLDSDLYEILLACAKGTLKSVNPKWKSKSTCGVVIASGGYPGSIVKGKLMSGLDQVNQINLLGFHAGTEMKNGSYYTSGGRVITVVAVEDDLETAVKRARHGASLITFENCFYRKDIALKAAMIIQQNKMINLTHGLDYKSSGVDIDAGNRLVNDIKYLAKKTFRTGIIGQIGGFGGLFDLKHAGYLDPILVAGTDGVGTKLKISIETKIYNTVGIDLVAMSVNDILVQGAEPLFFLDYFACSKLNNVTAAQVIDGISKGCQLANCALIGGETAEMPGMYAKDDFDLAGFAVGAVNRDSILPKLNEIKENDVVIGLPSTGVHSNGFSLVRKLIEIKSIKYSDKTPFDQQSTFAQVLLTPTKIYVKSLMSVIKKGYIKALSHITGGGLIENIPRILPETLGVELDSSKWRIPPIFNWIKKEGNVFDHEMLKTFNCGLGMVCIVDPKDIDQVLNIIGSNDEEVFVVGKVVKRSKDIVIVNNFSTTNTAQCQMKPSIDLCKRKPLKKRIGVLISGSGTNLQALIDHTKNPDNESAAEIVLVISNKAGVEGLKRAERAGIPTKVVRLADFPKEAFESTEKQREAFDTEMHKALTECKVDIVCAAGYMRILSEKFINLWNGKLINIHPSILPAFPGVNAYKQALDNGNRITGCTVHFICSEIDAGAIIAQDHVFIEPNDTEKTLEERGKSIEHKLYCKSLELLARDKIQLSQDGKKVIWND